MKEKVIILHGIFRTARSMKGLARFLEQNGYDVLNLDYPSTRDCLSGLVDYVHPHIQEFLQDYQDRVYLVGYSMGGLLIRVYLTRYPLAQLKRVVMIGTPNHGSEVADRIKDFLPYRWLYGKAGQQLITDQQNLLPLLGKVEYELGIIAGNRPIDIISSRIIGKPNDGKVSVESTKLKGMKAHLILPYDHTLFPHRKGMWQQVLHFLQEGEFNK